jgi:iron complex transport system substrate-binding protein
MLRFAAVLVLAAALPATAAERVIALSPHLAELACAAGGCDRLVGVVAWSDYPERVKQLPQVGDAFAVNVEQVVALRPDLVLGFSDLQGEIASELVKRGYPVMVFNQRSVAEILQMIRVVGAVVGSAARAEALADRLEMDLDFYRASAASLPQRPRIYFEEWDDPLISGIRWVEELIEIAGGQPIFPELREAGLAKQRIVDPSEVARRAPDIIIASWCGKPVKKDAITSRPGWRDIPAVRDGHVYEVKSSLILQPGPAALTDGIRALQQIIMRVARATKRRRVG